MRSAGVTVLVLLALARPASAEVPLPRRTIALGFAGQGATVGGLSQGGGGPSFEVALGDGRWQYFAEAQLMWVGIANAAPPVPEGEPAGAMTAPKVEGILGRAGVGVRWLARATELDESGGIELNVEAFSGVEQFHWLQGGRLMRPDFGAGISWQVRLYKRPRLAIRFSVRALFAPFAGGSASEAICRGTCAARGTPWTPGLMGGLGVAW